MKMIKIDLQNPDPKAIQEAAEVIRSGGMVVFPSDTCYGLAADFMNPKALKKVFKIKRRPAEKQLSVIVRDLAMIRRFCRVTSRVEKIIQKYLPGAVTIILPIKPEIKSKQKTLGIRIPDTPVTTILSGMLEEPYTATSANISGEPVIYTSRDIKSNLIGGEFKPDLFLDAGILPKTPPSTIIDLSKNPPQILRHGSVKINIKHLS